MTLPTLLTDVRGKELETGLKKGYSTLEQALNMYYADNNIRLAAGDPSAYKTVKGILTKYIINAVECSWGTMNNSIDVLKASCVPNNLTGKSDDELGLSSLIKYKTFNGKRDMALNLFDDGQFIAADGMLILLENNNNNAVFISVDVNGFRKPNRLGQDLFMFDLGTDGVLRPMGAPGTTYTNMNTYCSATSSSNLNGAACTYKAFTDKNFFRNLPK